MTLEELIELQRAWGLGSVHLVELDMTSFRLAHTDEERAAGTNHKPCPVHQWLENSAGPPAPLGIYVVTAERDTWELHRLEPMT